MLEPKYTLISPPQHWGKNICGPSEGTGRSYASEIEEEYQREDLGVVHCVASFLGRSGRRDTPKCVGGGRHRCRVASSHVG